MKPNLNIPPFCVKTSKDQSPTVLTDIVRQYLRQKGFVVPDNGTSFGNASKEINLWHMDSGSLCWGYSDIPAGSWLRVFDARTQMGEFINFIETETAKPAEKPIEIKLNGDYTAVVEGQNVRVGCQLIPVAKVLELAKAIEARNK